MIPGNRPAILLEMLRENGLRWALLAIVERIGLIGPERRHRLERKNELPGFNTVSYNRRVWSEYNWTEMGEEWNDSIDWKNALVTNFILRHFKPGHVILEIGPGAGRWATLLAPMASTLHLVDITETTLGLSKNRLSHHTHCQYHLATDGSLSFLPNGVIDYVWSFDVFVHIAPVDTLEYIHGLSRVMKKGGLGIIHHPADGNVRGGFRSSVTNEFFLNALRSNGFKVVLQTADFGEQDFGVKHFNDLITVFERA